MKSIVVFSGAGMSAESGLRTFRDSGGLWEEFNIEDVATPEAWHTNPGLVLDFYNHRRKQVLEAKPHAGHVAIARLEKHFDVTVITQNIDDLHERAGSTKVLHLHGEILKVRPVNEPQTLIPISGDLKLGDVSDAGVQLRPHVVWFGEEVPAIDEALHIIRCAHVLVIVGTSLNVYPAAGLVNYAPKRAKIYLIDPNIEPQNRVRKMIQIQENATTGVPQLVRELLMDAIEK